MIKMKFTTVGSLYDSYSQKQMKTHANLPRKNLIKLFDKYLVIMYRIHYIVRDYCDFWAGIDNDKS